MARPAGDLYSDPESGVLRNRAGITDAISLQQHEAMWAAAGSLRWASKPEATSYDLAHLQKIHARLYGETYEWAGATRTVERERQGIAYASPTEIQSNSATLFAQLQAEKKTLDRASPELFAARVGYYMAELTRLEPFHIGSARTQQVFITQLARDAGYNIQWQKIDRERMAHAQGEALHGNRSPYIALLKAHLVERSLEARMKDGRQDRDVSAMRVIEHNRHSLQVMERSHPEAHEKQGVVRTANVMLNSLEFAVRNKQSDLALSLDPSAPSKTRDFQAVPIQISSKDSLALVKQSIHAVERAGTRVHHELSQQWHSKSEFQIGADRAK